MIRVHQIRIKPIVLALSMTLFPLCGFAAKTTGNFADYLKKPKENCTETSCLPGAYVIQNSTDLQTVSKGLIGQKQDLLGPSEWSNKHYALLMAPNSYSLTTPESRTILGFYTQILGVGNFPDEVRITPGIEVFNQCPVDAESCKTTGGLVNFWRGLENVQLANKGSSVETLRFAVSQASPLRRVHVTGKMALCDWQTPSHACGYTSGGFMANSKVDDELILGSQQQWILRNSQIGANSGSAIWNMVLVGSGNSPTPPSSNPHQEPNDNTWINFPITNKDKTPAISEKPYLVKSGETWQVVVPGLKLHSTGYDLTDKSQKTLDVATQFFTVGPDLGTLSNDVTTLNSNAVKTINDQLAQGKNLIIMPGVYKLASPIHVVKENTVILGLGIPTLICENANNLCMDVSAEKGVKLAGLMFEASSNQPAHNKALLQVGTSKNQNNNSANPNVLQDIYVRVAITDATSKAIADTGIIVYANDTIGDNLWIWRGDHNLGGKKSTWNDNKAKHGLVVYGDRGIFYGLAVEHFQDYQTMWYGQQGEVYFYQSEMPYEVPNEALTDWTCSLPTDTEKKIDTHNGCASYWVSPDVTTHTGQGIGVYTYFRDTQANPVSGMRLPNGDEIKITGIVGRWLDGYRHSGMQTLIEDFATPTNKQGYSPVDTSEDVKTSDLGVYKPIKTKPLKS